MSHPFCRKQGGHKKKEGTHTIQPQINMYFMVSNLLAKCLKCAKNIANSVPTPRKRCSSTKSSFYSWVMQLISCSPKASSCAISKWKAFRKTAGRRTSSSAKINGSPSWERSANIVHYSMPKHVSQYSTSAPSHSMQYIFVSKGTRTRVTEKQWRNVKLRNSPI